MHFLPAQSQSLEPANRLLLLSLPACQTPCNPAHQNVIASGLVNPPHAQSPVGSAEKEWLVAPIRGVTRRTHPGQWPHPHFRVVAEESRSMVAVCNSSAPRTAQQYSIRLPLLAGRAPRVVSFLWQVSKQRRAAKMPASCSIPPSRFHLASGNTAARISLPEHPRNIGHS